jgi:hypothetical protein
VVDHSARSLLALQNSASTARVLNLLSIAHRRRGEPGHQDRPFFRNPRLNQSIFVKHRLKSNEHDLFAQFRQTATKIVAPFDPQDLGLGGGYCFVGQRNYAAILEQAFGAGLTPEASDWRTLEAIDELPSLDPFLLRDQLKRRGLEPARCYFEISDADIRRMFDFVEKEVLDLVSMSLGGDARSAARVSVLAKKLMSDTIDADLDPLRLTLRLTPEDFVEGVFSWRGFLYYKWSLMELLPEVKHTVGRIATITSHGQADPEARAYLGEARPRVNVLMKAALKNVMSTLSVYDTAYGRLTRMADPLAFRDFLVTAPPLFRELGDRLGAVRHVVSTCSHRFGEVGGVVTHQELADLFMEFEDCLGFAGPPGGLRASA